MPHSKGFAFRREERRGDPVPIGEIVDDLLREDVFARGMPLVRLIRAWPELVGERLAGATVPVSLEAGVLTVRAADGPWASQARYFTEEIRARADGALGGDAVTAVRIVVGRPPTDRNPRSGAG
jgi:hypothetical protein